MAMKGEEDMVDTDTELAAPGNLVEPAVSEQKAETPAKPRRRRTPAAKQPEPSATVEAKKSHRYQAKRAPIYHPYQKKLIPVSGWAELVPDNWVEVQLSAKVITDLGAA